MRRMATVTVLAGVILTLLAMTFSPEVSAQTPQGPAQSDHALLNNSGVPGPGPDTAIYCGVATIGNQGEPYTLHVAATASGTAGTLTITFGDGDGIGFIVPADGSFSTTQELGGVPGTDDVVKITVAGGVTAAMASVKVRAGAKDPFPGDGELDNFCLTTPGDPGTVPF